jgi:uncharacterized protein YbdZ (MbtH family)
MAIGLLLFCSVVPKSRGYVLEGFTWPAGNVTFQSELGAAGRTLIDGNTSWDTAAAPAALAWNAVMVRLQIHTTVAVGAPVRSGDGTNSVLFSDTVFGDSFGSNTLAVTVYLTSGRQMIEADVVFNNQQHFDSYRGPLRFDPNNGSSIGDIQRVLTHELGHAIGLDHPDDHGQHVDAIMNSVTSNRYTLSPDDIAGARTVNGQPIRADFNSDGFGDYVLMNSATRQTALWHLHDGALASGGYGPMLPAGWTVACTVDMDGDGKPDFVLFNPHTNETVIWFMNDAMFTMGVAGPTLPAGWSLVTSADFNSDGVPDYLLLNKTTGQTAIWFLEDNNDIIHLLSTAYGPTVPAGWTLVDADDFNGDGKPDFVLANTRTHQTAFWYLNGTNVIGGAFGRSLPVGWKLQGTSDFNGDGHPDYLLSNGSTGQTAIWYLNGAAVVGGTYGPVPAAGYSLASP